MGYLVHISARGYEGETLFRAGNLSKEQVVEKLREFDDDQWKKINFIVSAPWLAFSMVRSGSLIRGEEIDERMESLEDFFEYSMSFNGGEK